MSPDYSYGAESSKEHFNSDRLLNLGFLDIRNAMA